MFEDFLQVVYSSYCQVDRFEKLLCLSYVTSMWWTCVVCLWGSGWTWLRIQTSFSTCTNRILSTRVCPSWHKRSWIAVPWANTNWAKTRHPANFCMPKTFQSTASGSKGMHAVCSLFWFCCLVFVVVVCCIDVWYCAAYMRYRAWQNWYELMVLGFPNSACFAKTLVSGFNFRLSVT